MKSVASMTSMRLAVLLGVASESIGQDSLRVETPPLDMTRPVACSKVIGFEDYVVLPESKLTSEEKLKVYFRPLHFKIEPVKTRYHAKLTEDGRVRRKGEKTPLSKEDKLLEFEETFDTPSYQIYLVNTVGLKNLPPGDYEFDIILHDALVEGSSTTRTIPFTIIPTPKAEGAAESVDPATPLDKKTAKKGKTKPARPKGS